MSMRSSVLIVDDSRTSRAYIESLIDSQPDLKVVGSVFSGEKALDFLRTTIPDLVTLDIEMPGLGGIETLNEIQKINNSLPLTQRIGVLLVSAYASEAAEMTLLALTNGAYDFVTKPSTQINGIAPTQFNHELITKLRMYPKKRKLGNQHAPDFLSDPKTNLSQKLPANISQGRSFRAILIGSSTGGPKALADLLPKLTHCTDAPILVVQHMPIGFTRSLAENLQRLTTWKVQEAEDQQEISQRNIYIARGGRHLTMKCQESGNLIQVLTDEPPESGCKPSASVMFRSAAAELGSQALAIILTGMGNDGAAGLCDLHRQGGYVIAQNESSSVVWGMPGSAVAEGVVQRVLPLDFIAAHVADLSRH